MGPLSKVSLCDSWGQEATSGAVQRNTQKQLCSPRLRLTGMGSAGLGDATAGCMWLERIVSCLVK
jgi:hypothetical protein